MIWNNEHEKFIHLKYKKLSRIDLLNEFNKRFGVDISIIQLNNFLTKNKGNIKNGIIKDGIFYEKSNSGKLKAYHHSLYEKHHGIKLRPNELVIFLDGNKRNFKIENFYTDAEVNEMISIATRAIIVPDSTIKIYMEGVVGGVEGEGQLMFFFPW